MMREGQSCIWALTTFLSSVALGSEQSLSSLVSHRPIDVLPDRQAETSAAWMRENPEIAVVSRDRGSRVCISCDSRRSSSSSVCRQIPALKKSRRGFRGLSGASSGCLLQTSDTSHARFAGTGLAIQTSNPVLSKAGTPSRKPARGTSGPL